MQKDSILASRQEQEGIQESRGTGGSAVHASHPVTVLDQNDSSPIFVLFCRWAVNYYGIVAVSHLMSRIRVSINVVGVDVEGHQTQCFEGWRIHCSA